MPSSRKMKAIIVEDEESPRQLLRRLLERWHSDQVEVIAEAQTGTEALALCETHRPDLLFLDIGIPGPDGIEVLSQLRSETHVIITTGDMRRAAEAFGSDAVDYVLLKPAEPQRLAEAINRVTFSIASERIGRLLCKDHEDVKVVDIDDVLFIQADGGYANVRTEDSYYLLNDSLASLEERLPEYFVRVHRMTIVNARHVRRIAKGGESAVLGSKGLDVPISRRHLREFRRKLMYIK